MAKKNKARMRKIDRGTVKQHKELDTEYRAQLLPKEDWRSHYWNQWVLAVWAEEKHYLSRYGERFGRIVNIESPSDEYKCGRIEAINGEPDAT